MYSEGHLLSLQVYFRRQTFSSTVQIIVGFALLQGDSMSTKHLQICEAAHVGTGACIWPSAASLRQCRSFQRLRTNDLPICVMACSFVLQVSVASPIAHHRHTCPSVPSQRMMTLCETKDIRTTNLVYSRLAVSHLGRGGSSWGGTSHYSNAEGARIIGFASSWHPSLGSNVLGHTLRHRRAMDGGKSREIGQNVLHRGWIEGYLR